MQTHFLSIFVVVLLCSILLSAQPLTLPALFSDGMVLQQRTDAPVWGTGTPGTAVRLSASWGITAHCTVGADGRWRTTLRTPKAGGPFSLTVTHGTETRTLTDVLIGEVWICSGQSNMEMPMRGFPPNELIAGAQEEIAAANAPQLRMFTVEKMLSLEERTVTNGAWLPATPANVPEFSATGYYFGAALHRALKVPVGLIHASWGGTPVQAWTSEAFIRQHPLYMDAGPMLEQTRKEHADLTAWLASLPSVDVGPNRASQDWSTVQFNDAELMQPAHPDSSWRSMDLPRGWEWTEVGAFDGVVWFRKKVEIPSAWRGKELLLELGTIDDMDATFVNGTMIGSMLTGSPWNIERRYTIPASLTADSLLTIAIRVIDFGGGGGLWSTPDKLSLSLKNSTERMSLAGPWRYRAVAEIRGNTAYLLDPRNNTSRPAVTRQFNSDHPAVLYNGMIAPLVPYAVKGAVWYQGEANVSDPAGYEGLFPLMIRNWRSDWKRDFSFYFVQIAPFEYGPVAHSELLREAQLRTLSVPKTGMAVTLDIGDSVSIHPANKKDVGDRLSRWALAKEYGKKVEYSGPVYRSFTVKKDVVILTFDHAKGLTLRPETGKPLFQVAGADGVFHPGTATVKGTTVIVRSAAVPQPAAVRYGWQNVVRGTLFNAAGLPASSFRTDTWDN
ncbi:MAG: glycosyl hydrolase family 2 [Bacteroidetes bacterium]|nr:glycosyl hydrolase family 2 [Bacteroidota bacterium]